MIQTTTPSEQAEITRISHNDVRMDNWILGYLDQKPLQVDWLAMKHLSDGNVQAAFYDNRPVYVGIPLTPEILLKAGFEVSEDGYGGWLSPKIGGNRIRLIKEDVGYSFYNGICKTIVVHVHTLQNYYPAWTSGTELTLTL
jgi:hypothetical protein